MSFEWGRICNRCRRPRRCRSGTGSSGDFGWAFPNRWGGGGYKAPPLREGFGVGSDLEPRQMPRRRRSGTGSSGDFGWAFPNRWGGGGYKAPPLREGFGVGSDLQPRQRLRRRRSGTGSSGDSGWAFPNLSKYKCVFRAGECQKEAFRSLPFRSFSYLCVPKNWD